jgi:hypothetical protein
MSRTYLQKAYSPLKKALPAVLSRWLRSVSTAVITPIRFSYTTGHFRSSIKNVSVNKKGEFIPWYSYPAIDFIINKDFSDKRVLEFGAGQSSLWWGKKAKYIKSFEEDLAWYNQLKTKITTNIELVYSNLEPFESCLKVINDNLVNDQKYDIIIIDGLYRYELCEVAINNLAEGGVIIADNSEGNGYNFQRAFKNTGFSRVDFHGFSPGVVLRQGTSFFFRDNSFIFSNESPIDLIL